MPKPSPKQGRAMLDVPSTAAAGRMQMTKQERKLYEHHAANLKSGQYVMQPNGMISTVREIPVRLGDGKWYSIPTIWDGRQLSDDDAVKRAFGPGGSKPDDWPSAPSLDALEKRYGELHDFMEKDVNQLEIQRERRRNYQQMEPVLSSRHSETYD